MTYGQPDLVGYVDTAQPDTIVTLLNFRVDTDVTEGYYEHYT